MSEYIRLQQEIEKAHRSTRAKEHGLKGIVLCSTQIPISNTSGVQILISSRNFCDESDRKISVHYTTVEDPSYSRKNKRKKRKLVLDSASRQSLCV